MFGWVRRRLEARQSSSYTDLILQARVAQAAAGDDAALLAGTTLAAVEAAAGVWERGMSGGNSDMLAAADLAVTGRALLLRGEAVFVRVGGRLVPASHWDVQGSDPDPLRWRYRADVQSPNGMRTMLYAGRDVFHPRININPSRPWEGVSPLALMPLTLRLLSAAEASLANEHAGANGRLIPVPAGASTADLETSIRTLAGRSLLVETTAAGFGQGMTEAPRQDWVPRRLGPEPAEGSARIHDQATRAVLAAAGVPVELIDRADGAAAREAWRRFLFATVAPVARMVGDEAALKLGSSGRITFEALRASDLTGRARAWRSLVDGGMDRARAEALCGFDG